MYLAVKHIHITLIVLSLVLLCYRFVASKLMSKSLPKFLKVVPHIVDTFILISALTLCIIIKQYPLVDSWLTIKVGFVVGYIISALFAMKAQVKWKSIALFILAIVCLAMAAKIALLKTAF